MKTKHVVASILYVFEAIFCFLLFLGSGALLGIIGAAKGQATDQATLAALAITEAASFALFFYGLITMILSVIGVILAAKKASGEKILNFLSVIAASYLLVLIITALVTLSYADALGVNFDMAQTTIRLIIISLLIIALIVSLFLRYDRHRIAKCVIMICAIGATLLLEITSTASDNSNAIYIILLTLGQLILPIIYLVSKDEEADSYISPSGQEDPMAELKKLDDYLEAGYITQEEYEQARQKYIDKL